MPQEAHTKIKTRWNDKYFSKVFFFLQPACHWRNGTKVLFETSDEVAFVGEVIERWGFPTLQKVPPYLLQLHGQQQRADKVKSRLARYYAKTHDLNTTKFDAYLIFRHDAEESPLED